MKYMKRAHLTMSFASSVPADAAAFPCLVHRRHNLLARLLVSVIVVSLALVTVPCCTLFGNAYAAPVAAADHHTDDHHETGHSHSTPDMPNGDTDDHCAHWVDANPFLASGHALLASSTDTPAWHRTAMADLQLLEPPAQRILRPPIHLRTSFPRLYRLYAHLLL
jgi:hypothetical protein